MADVTTVSFVVDGYTFDKSIEDARKIMYDLESKISQARIYMNLPYANGRLTMWNIRDIVQPYLELNSAYKDELDEEGRQWILISIWRRLTEDNAGIMYCPHCDGVPLSYHRTGYSFRWEINIYVLINYVDELLKGRVLDGALRESYDYLRVYLKGLLIKCL